MTDLLYKDESYQIVGACFEVHKQLGSGFLEAVYQESLEIELSDRVIPFVAQPELTIQYKGQTLNSTYKADFVCFELIILEIKAVSDINDMHRAQVQNYLKATGFRLGLLVNFCSHFKLQYERIVR